MATELKLWGRILIHNELVTEDQWGFIADQYKARSKKPPIGKMLVKAGYLTAEQRDFVEALVAKLQTKKKKRDADGRLIVDLSEDEPGSMRKEFKAHPDSFRDRDFEPDEQDMIDIETEHVVFNGEAATVKQHISSVQDRDFVPREEDMIDIAPERDEDHKAEFHDANYIPEKFRHAASKEEFEEGDGEIEITGLEDEPEGATDTWKPSEVDWVETSEHIEEDFHIDDSDKIELAGDDD